MKKNAAGQTGRGSKIRIIVVDADVAEGELSHLTEAITNAIRPPSFTTRLIAPAPSDTLRAKQNGLDAAPDLRDAREDESEVMEVEEPVAAAKGSGTPRFYTPPKVLPDLDLSGFKRWLKAYRAPKNAQEMHLLAVYWFKQEAATLGVGLDEVFSAYNAAGWKNKVADFDAPFRKLKSKGYIKKEGGKYVIGLTGMNAVSEMLVSASANDAE